MKVFDYYFLLEFGWRKKDGFYDGFPRIKIRSTSEFNLKHGYVNFELLESVFVSNAKMKSIAYVDDVIMNIQNVQQNIEKSYLLFNEVVALEISKNKIKIIDMLVEDYVICFEEISINELREIIKDWKSFLIESNKKTLCEYNNFDDNPPR